MTRLGKVRIRGHWQTYGHGEARRQARVFEVFGPTGLVVWRGESFTEAMVQADRESRRPEWREAAGVHECTQGALLRLRPVGTEGVYCGHGRYLAQGELFYLSGVPTRIGRFQRQEPRPSYLRILGPAASAVDRAMMETGL